MSKEEFYNIKCGDRVFDIELKKSGTVMVESRGEVYVEFDYCPNYLQSYDIYEDHECYKKLMLENE